MRLLRINVGRAVGSPCPWYGPVCDDVRSARERRGGAVGHEVGEAPLPPDRTTSRAHLAKPKLGFPAKTQGGFGLDVDVFVKSEGLDFEELWRTAVPATMIASDTTVRVASIATLENWLDAGHREGALARRQDPRGQEAEAAPGQAAPTAIGQTSARAPRAGAPQWRVQKRNAGAAL